MSRPGPFDGYGKPRRRRDVRIVPRHEVAAPPQFRTPDPPRKRDCPGHVAGTDSIGRMPIGDCGPDCVIRRHRLGIAVWDGERWT